VAAVQVLVAEAVRAPAADSVAAAQVAAALVAQADSSKPEAQASTARPRRLHPADLGTLLVTQGAVWGCLLWWRFSVLSLAVPEPSVVELGLGMLPQLAVLVAYGLWGVVGLVLTERWRIVRIPAQLLGAAVLLMVQWPLVKGVLWTGSAVRWTLATWWIETAGAADDGARYMAEHLGFLAALWGVVVLLALVGSKRRQVLGCTALAAVLLLASLPGAPVSRFPRYLTADALVYLVHSRIGLDGQWDQLRARPVPSGMRLGPELPNGTNVVVVFLESVGANAVTAYNPAMKTTPFLDGLAHKSLFAERAYVVASSTYKAHVASLCGVEPYFNGDRELAEAAFDFPCLPAELAGHGYQTVYFSSSGRDMLWWTRLVDHLGFEDFLGFEDMETEGFEAANDWAYEDDIMLGPSEAWLRKNGDRPFVAAYMTATPHFEYRAPTRYGRHDYVPDPVQNRYLNAVHYVDQFVANLVGQYERLGLAENTVFVVVGDHGEAFYEHTPKQHNASAYEPVVRVPLLLYAPGLTEGRRVGGLVSQLDITPTLVDMLGMSAEEGTMQGVSVFHEDPLRSRLHTACLYAFTCAATITQTEKFIHHFDDGADELFSLETDPAERTNLAAERPQQSRALRAETRRWYLHGAD
jgi:arylsulfatase A-like enzyme